MSPQTRRLLGFGMLAASAHLLVLWDGAYRGSARDYLNPHTGHMVILAPRVMPPPPVAQADNPQIRRTAAMPITVAASAPAAQMERPPSSRLDANPEVDAPAQMRDEIFLPQRRYGDVDGDLIQVRLWIDDTGQVTRVAILHSALADSDEADIVRQLQQARFIPAYKDGLPVASVLTGGLSAD